MTQSENRSARRSRRMIREAFASLQPYLDCIAATIGENLELMQKLGLTENIHRKNEKFHEMMEYDIIHHSDIPQAVRESDLFHIRVHFFLGGILRVYQRWAALYLTAVFLAVP